MEETEQRVEEDRTHYIDALIVRIMKGKKEARHNDLVGEVLQGLVFNVSPATIKARIETLIDRGKNFIGGDRDTTVYSWVCVTIE